MKLCFLIICLHVFTRWSFCLTIIETLEQAGNFSTLSVALRRTNSNQTLDGTGQFTIFAPTDKAFQTLLSQLKVDMMGFLQRQDLTDLLNFHVVPGRMTNDKLRSETLLQTLQGAQLRVIITALGVTIRNAALTTADMLCDNGVIHVIEQVQLPPVRNQLVGGTNGWDPSAWTTVSDGTMGGSSTGSATFVAGSMVFAGSINLNGGGFASAKISTPVDLSGYSGLWLEIGTTIFNPNKAPLTILVQLTDKTGRDFSAPVTLPIAESQTKSRVYAPFALFDEHANFQGFDGDRLDRSSVRKLSLYVLYQAGVFEVRVHEISAVMSPNDAPAVPSAPIVHTLEQPGVVSDFLESTIASGDYVYRKGFHGLCASMYASAARSILVAGRVRTAVRGVACAGLSRAAARSMSEQAWVLRRTFDAILDDETGHSRKSSGEYPAAVQGSWLPAAGAPSSAVSSDCSWMVTSASVPGSTLGGTSDPMSFFQGPFVGMVIYGNDDFGLQRVSSPEDCARICVANTQCRSFDYGARGDAAGECWLSRANRLSAGSDYKSWAVYDYYEFRVGNSQSQRVANSSSPKSQFGATSNSPLNQLGTPSSASANNDGTLAWVCVLVVALICLMLGLVIVLVLLYLRRTASLPEPEAKEVKPDKAAPNITYMPDGVITYMPEGFVAV